MYVTHAIWNVGYTSFFQRRQEEEVRKIMKIAIIGGAGFIGSHLAKAYLDAGHDVLIIDTLINGSLEAVDARARFYQVDMRDRKLLSILQRERPDIVSHHAVHRSPDSQPL